MTRKYNKEKTIFIVMSPCHSLVIPLRLLTLKPIVLDAGWSLTEATRVRKLGSKFLGHKIYTFLVDLISFHLSNNVTLESNNQKGYIKRKYFLRQSKLHFVFTGFNEVLYENLTPVLPVELSTEIDFQRNYILFRGSYTSEAGIDILNKIAQSSELSCQQFVIATNVSLRGFENLKNVRIIQRRLTESEIKYLYLNCLFTIGQIRKTPRLINTIPHKAFEAAYFGKPYLTANASGIRELLPYNHQAIYSDSENPHALAKLIKQNISDRKLLQKTGENAQLQYGQVASQQKLQDQFFEILKSLNIP